MSGPGDGRAGSVDDVPPGPGSPGGRRTQVLFGMRIDALTMDETVTRIDELVTQGGTHLHVSVNVDKVVKASRDDRLRAIVNSADIVNADGQPVVWASRLLGRPLPGRVTGIDLMQRLIAHAAATGLRMYFLGARPEVVAAVVERVRREHPGATIAGSRDGYWQLAQEEQVAQAVAAAAPDLLFLAIPSPAKERFLDRWREVMGARFVMGVGGSFDVYAGLVPRAPSGMQRAGLEWAYRLAQEPRRMWRRYLVEDVRFLPLVVGEWLRTRTRRPRAGRPATGRPLRILVVTNLYPGPGSPAFGTFVAARVEALRAAGAEVHVSAIRDAEVHRRRPAKYMRLAASALVSGSRLAAQRRKIDVVEAHIAFPTGWLAWPVAVLHRAPLVLFVHGSDVVRIARRSPAHAWAARVLFRRAAAVVVNSRYMAGVLDQLVHLPGERVVVRSPGIERRYLTPKDEGADADHPRAGLLFVGRLHRGKGVHELLAAVARLRRRRAIPSLTMIGDGPERCALEATIAREGLSVELRGPLPPAAVASSMRACSVLVVPSTAPEALGLVAIEGMASGALVVASGSGGLAETIVEGRTGISAGDADPVRLADALERALDVIEDPGRRVPILARARAAAQAHDVELVARDSLDDYRLLIRRR